MTKAGIDRNDFFLGAVRSLAIEAGVAILKFPNSGNLPVVKKKDNSPVTAADLAAHSIIFQGLHNLDANIPVISEEMPSEAVNLNMSNKFWLVDPLDGTKEFIRGSGEFTVNIALIENGEPVLGVVYAPILDVCYYALRGLGSFKLKKKATPQRISVVKNRETNWTVVASRSHKDLYLEHFLERIGNHTLLNVGSSLKFCLVAEGQADVYPRFAPTSLWDTAAGQCVLEEAGGSVVQLTGKKLSYKSVSNLINPSFLATSQSFLNFYSGLDA